MSDEKIKSLLDNVPSNPKLIEWPLDRHGFTSGLRKEGLLAAGRIGTDREKQKLALITLAILTKHIQNRMKADEAFHAASNKFRTQYEKDRVRQREVFGALEAKKDETAAEAA